MSHNQRRSNQANKLYHALCADLHNLKKLSIWDGRFTEYGLPNPVFMNPQAFRYDNFRDIMKSLDFEYPRAENQLPKSSALLNVQEFNSHITFLECLLMEIK
jgi:hypothetical protein